MNERHEEESNAKRPANTSFEGEGNGESKGHIHQETMEDTSDYGPPVLPPDPQETEEETESPQTEQGERRESGDSEQEDYDKNSSSRSQADTEKEDDETVNALPPSGTSNEEPDRPMSLMEHLQELRRCLAKSCIAVFLCFISCWFFVDYLFNLLVDPLLHALPPGSHAMYTTLPEGFFTRMFLAFVAGVFAASPVIFYQIWSFIAPGLYDSEKRYIIPIAFLSAIFFVGGAVFCFYIVFPYVFTFFIGFATEEIVAMPKVSDYLDFVLKLLIAFGLIFEMPLFTFFLSRLGIVTAKGMRGFRQYAVLLIFVVAAILTPPDVVSQILMAGPMLILYELSIFIAAIFGRKSPRKVEKKNEADIKTPDGTA